MMHLEAQKYKKNTGFSYVIQQQNCVACNGVLWLGIIAMI